MQRIIRAVMVGTALYSSGGCDAPTGDASLGDYFCGGVRGLLSRDSVPDQLPQPDLSGINAANYDPSEWITVKLGMSALLLTDRTHKVSQVRDSAFRVSLSKYFSEREAVDSAEIAKLRPLLDSAALEDLLAQRGILAQHMRLIKHAAFGNCKDRSYNYWVQYGMVRNKMAMLPPELQEAVKVAVSRHLREPMESARSGGSEVINLQDIVYAIRRDARIQQIARRTLNSLGDGRLKYTPDDVLFFLRFVANGVIAQSAMPFKSAEYRLTHDMAFLVDLIVRELLGTRSSGVSYGLVSRGFADAQPVRFIRYDGSADLGLELNQIASLARIGSSAAISTNLELSTARGHAGAAKIAEVLRDLGVPVTGRSGIPVGYSGGGEIPGSILPANRRIEIVIRPIRNLPELGQ